MYVRPGENIGARVSSLYDKISQPALTDVALDIEGVGAYDSTQRRCPTCLWASNRWLWDGIVNPVR